MKIQFSFKYDKNNRNCTCRPMHIYDNLIFFSSLSDDRSKASSKTIPPHSAIQSLLFQMRLSSPVLKVIQNIAEFFFEK